MSEPYALGSFSEQGGESWPGIVRAGKVLPLRSLLPDMPFGLGGLFERWPEWGSRIDAAMASAPATGWLAEDKLEIHLPFKPENLYGAGANYRKHVIDLIVDKGAGNSAHLGPEQRRAHAVELMDRRAATGTPFVFIAPRSAIGGSRDPLILPYDVAEPDWELELAVVIGKPARRIRREDALDYVAGYTILNDVTARERVDRPDIPQMGMDWLAAKAPPGFKILGPYVTPARFVPDPQDLRICLSLNGEMKQNEGTSDMIFPVARLIEFVSANLLLHPGDVIMTGSPSGNGTHYGRFLQDGDVMVGQIHGILGSQVTPCRLEVADPSSVTA